MGQADRPPSLSAGDYLAWEATQTQRHELIHGEAYAMASAEDRHVTVSLDVAMAMRQHLSGTPCRTYLADMKLQVSRSQSFFYPDVLVS